MSRKTPAHETYYPKKSQVAALLGAHPEEVFYDEAGRLYGRMPEGNPASEALVHSGRLSAERGTLHLWVHLSGKPHERGLQRPEVEPQLEFPRVGEELTLMNYASRNVAMQISPLEYPEWMSKKTKSASLLCRAEEREEHEEEEEDVRRRNVRLLLVEEALRVLTGAPTERRAVPKRRRRRHAKRGYEPPGFHPLRAAFTNRKKG